MGGLYMSSGRSAILLKLNNPPKQGNSWIQFWELKDILTVRSQVFVRFHFIESSDIPIRSALAHARIILRSGLQTEAEQEDETKLSETHGATADCRGDLHPAKVRGSGYNSFDSDYRNINQFIEHILRSQKQTKNKYLLYKNPLKISGYYCCHVQCKK